MATNNSWNSNNPAQVALGMQGNSSLTARTVLVGNGTGAVTQVGPGTAGQTLVGVTSSNPAYITPTAGASLSVTTNSTTLSWGLTSPYTVSSAGTGLSSFTANTVITAGTTSTGNLQQVSGVGSANQLLTSAGAGALPTWSNAAASGNLKLLSTQTASSSASIAFTSGISSSYPSYMILISNASTASSSVSFNMDFSTNGGSSYLSTNFLSGLNWTLITSYSLTNKNSTSTCPLIDSALAMSSSDFFGAIIFLYNLGSSFTSPSYSGQISTYNSSTNSSFGMFFGAQNSTSTINAIRFSASSGNIATGDFSLYQITN